LTYQIPRVLTPAFRLGEVFGTPVTGRVLNYYLVFLGSLGLFLLLLRIVNSPFGRVLQAIRENDFRAEAIGYRVVWYRTAATCLSAAMAALAGSLYAIWLRYVGPDTTLSFEIMLDVLLMVVIGGMGTMYGAVLGAVIFVLAQNYLQNLMRLAADATADLPLLPLLLDPNRWLLWLGVLFILSVYFFPSGIVGRLRAGR
jgi:branched-chain amino acid transport system permease protein